MEAIVLAGGFGTRLREIAPDIPKPMVKVNGRPFLEYVLDFLERRRAQKVVLSVGHKYRAIQDFFGDSFRGIPLEYSIETKPLGTGGGIKKALPLTAGEDILVLNGDTLFTVDVAGLLHFHASKNAAATLAVKPMKDFSRYGAVVFDADNVITAFKEKNFTPFGFIYGGISILNKPFFQKQCPPDAFSFEKDFLEKYYAAGSFRVLPFDEFFIDIGTPEDYERAEKYFKGTERK